LETAVSKYPIAWCSIDGFIKGTYSFPIQKDAIFRKILINQVLRGSILLVCRPSDSADLSRLGVIDAEIAEKGHFWTETSLSPSCY
jgi:hypothetical protein